MDENEDILTDKERQGMTYQAVLGLEEGHIILLDLWLQDAQHMHDSPYAAQLQSYIRLEANKARAARRKRLDFIEARIHADVADQEPLSLR